MKKLNLLIAALLISGLLPAQSLDEMKSWNGTYYLMAGERSVVPGNQQATKKDLEIGENNGTILLATAECAKCTPSVFTYQKEISEKLEKPVFFNSMGLYMIPLDEDSFVYYMTTVKLGTGLWKSFYFMNYYSKDEAKAKEMTKEKLMEIGLKLSEQSMQ
ncbi:hypothetical protein [Ekhidna sp.]